MPRCRVPPIGDRSQGSTAPPWSLYLEPVAQMPRQRVISSLYFLTSEATLPMLGECFEPLLTILATKL